jgi:hypothetical protein
MSKLRGDLKFVEHFKRIEYERTTNSVSLGGWQMDDADVRET